MKFYVAYFRVSTNKQGQSGLGLEAQQKSVADFVARHGDSELLTSFVEVESGKKNNRPQLQNALDACKRSGAILIVAKLDRLSRNATFLLNLRDSGVKFVCCDMPDANEFTIHIYAALAEQERKLISERTKAALAAAKARGKNIGGKDRRNFHDGEQRGKPWEHFPEIADNNARRVSYHIEAAKQSGVLTDNAIAKYLNDKGIPTPRGKKWYAASVRRTIERLERIESAA